MSTYEFVYTQNPYARPISTHGVIAAEPAVSAHGINRKLGITLLVVMALVFGIMLLVQAGDAPSRKQIETLSSSNSRYTAQIGELQATLNEMTDISSIGTRATELGMQLPDQKTAMRLSAFSPRPDRVLYVNPN